MQVAAAKIRAVRTENVLSRELYSLTYTFQLT